MNIDTIQHGTGDFTEIAFDFEHAAMAAVGWGTIIAAGARVHAGKQRKGRGIGNGCRYARNRDNFVFKGLTQGFQSGFLKFRQFIEE